MFVNSSTTKNAAIYAFLNGKGRDSPAYLLNRVVAFNPELQELFVVFQELTDILGFTQQDNNIILLEIKINDPLHWL